MCRISVLFGISGAEARCDVGEALECWSGIVQTSASVECLDGDGEVVFQLPLFSCCKFTVV